MSSLLEQRYPDIRKILRDGAILLPSEPLPRARTMESHQVWSAESFICDLNHHCGLRLNNTLVEEKKACPQHAQFIDALVADLRTRLPHFGGYSHSNPDIRRVVSEGFDAMECELDAETAAVATLGDKADPGEANLLAAQQDAEKHADLIVRLGGYSEYFTKLNRALQDSVRHRTH